MKDSKGYIYILTNPSFPDYVKIGYADNVERRLNELNRSECVPFAFRVYATYEVNSRLVDKKFHTIIDKLNPNLRSIDEFNGQKRVREFFAISPEEAYSIFEAMAEIHGCTEKLKIWEPSPADIEAEEKAEEIAIERKERLAPFAFSYCHIPVGAELEFWRTAIEPTGIKCTVVDDKHVSYEGDIYSLTGLAKKLLETKSAIAGPQYFKYQDQWLNSLREDMKF